MSSLKEYKMSFADIVQGRDATVRVTEDKLIYAVDLVCVFTGKDNNHAAEAIRRLTDEEFDTQKFIERRLSTTGGRATKLLAFRDAISLVMVLKGKIAQKTRQEFADVIHRYMAGDLTLTEEIQTNAQSTAPVAQMARESLGIAVDADLALKRRWQEIEVDRAETEAKRMKIDTFNSFMTGMKDLDPSWQKDTRFVIKSKDYLKNIMFGEPALAIMDGTHQSVESGISISEVALAQGLGQLSHGDLCKAGKRAKELYVAKHGRAPPQRKQFVDGAERMVNSYTEADRGLLVDALRVQ